MEYKQSQQQGGGGGGQASRNRTHCPGDKDLIAAHRLIREGDKYTDQERKDGYEARCGPGETAH